MTAAAWSARFGIAAGEAAKLPAFVRRDFLVAWSYRVSFFSDFVNLAAQMLVFFYIGKMVESAQLPSYGGAQVSYLEFVTLGIVLNVFVQVALTRTAEALRTEQMIGTLEALLTTPTATPTIQLGSAVFDLVYVPLRTALFLGFMVLVVGLDLEPNGVLPSVVLLLAFIPFVWGLGMATAAAILAFRRGGGVMGVGAMILGLASGAFFPLALLPGWIAAAAEYNPLAIAIEGLREGLLGGMAWTGVGDDLLLLAPMSVASLSIGSLLFQVALRRERRRGTLGLY
ncbi:MAG: ABC transporter permease [Thermoleophilaceae bacterium]